MDEGVLVQNDFPEQFNFTSDLLGNALTTGRFTLEHIQRRAV